MNKIKTIDDALEVLNKAKEEYGNLPIVLEIDNGKFAEFVEDMNCLDIQYDENEVTFYNY